MLVIKRKKKQRDIKNHKKSIMTIIRIFIIYRPFRFFGTIGLILFSAGFLLGMRFLWGFLTGGGEGHIQSLILASVLLGMGFQTILIAFIADLLSANRKLLEDIRFKAANLSKKEMSHSMVSRNINQVKHMKKTGQAQ